VSSAERTVWGSLESDLGRGSCHGTARFLVVFRSLGEACGLHADNPCLQLAADVPRVLAQQTSLSAREVAKVFGMIELRSDFAGASLREVQELDQVGRGAALVSFRDVRRDGDGGPSEMIAETEVLPDRIRTRRPIDLLHQLSPSLPDRDIFKLLQLPPLPSSVLPSSRPLL